MLWILEVRPLRSSNLKIAGVSILVRKCRSIYSGGNLKKFYSGEKVKKFLFWREFEEVLFWKEIEDVSILERIWAA